MSEPATDRRVPDVIAFSLLVACAAVMAAGYALDLAGLPMSPWLLAVVFAGSAAGFAILARPRVFSSSDRADTIVFLAVVAASAAYLLYLASPALLPVTIGPDLVHHLQLIHVIQRTHALPHDPALQPFLVEMMNYTPGSHILAATVADWGRADALRLVQPIAAIFVALKMGLVYLLALRAGEAFGGRRVAAVAAPLLALVPAVYTLGSSFHFFFYAQVLSETFAIGMLLAAVDAIRDGEVSTGVRASEASATIASGPPDGRSSVRVSDAPAAISRGPAEGSSSVGVSDVSATIASGPPDGSTRVRTSEASATLPMRPGSSRSWCLVAFAACGIGVFLSWPVWLGPPIATLCFALLVARLSWRARMVAAAVAILPIVIVVAVHSMQHAAEGRILAASGTVTSPSVAAFGAGFLLCAIAGVVLSLRVRAALPVVVFLAVTLLQSLALAALAIRAGSGSFYMAFKMVYLAIFPAAVLGALALMWVSARLAGRRAALQSASAFAPLVVAVLLLVGRVPVSRQSGPIVPSARDAAVWVRAHTAPACVDYFTAHWLTGYWLHLDVLGNPRVSDRMRAETFEFRDTVGKWIEGRGLPYGIVEDLSALPRELRPDVTPVHRAGRFVVIRNHRPAPCP